MLAWLSVWSVVQMICNGPADAIAHPIISCFIKIQIGLTFLVPAYPGCPGKEAIKWASVCHICSYSITIFAAHYYVVNVLISNVIISLFCGVVLVRNIQCCPYAQIENVNCLYCC